MPVGQAMVDQPHRLADERLRRRRTCMYDLHPIGGGYYVIDPIFSHIRVESVEGATSSTG